MYKISIILLIVVLFCSCKTKELYCIQSDTIHSRIDFGQGFTLSKIEVDSVYKGGLLNGKWVDQNGFGHLYKNTKVGFPIKYEVIETVYLFKKQSNKAGIKRIFFTEKNLGYYWKTIGKSDNMHVVPGQFLTSGWYKISRLLDSNNEPSCILYFKKNYSGTYECFLQCNPAP